jgi:hypothetical protein
MAVRAVCNELVSGCRSLICWEDTGKCVKPAFRTGPDSPSRPVHAVLPGMFPKFGNRELPANEQGFHCRNQAPGTPLADVAAVRRGLHLEKGSVVTALAHVKHRTACVGRILRTHRDPELLLPEGCLDGRLSFGTVRPPTSKDGRHAAKKQHREGKQSSHGARDSARCLGRARD